MDAEALARLREVVEDDGSRLLTVDLAEKTVRSGNLVVTVDLPEGARVQLLEGKWDATADLLEAGQAIENTALSLPYLNDWA